MPCGRFGRTGKAKSVSGKSLSATLAKKIKLTERGWDVQGCCAHEFPTGTRRCCHRMVMIFMVFAIKREAIGARCTCVRGLFDAQLAHSSHLTDFSNPGRASMLDLAAESEG